VRWVVRGRRRRQRPTRGGGRGRRITQQIAIEVEPLDPTAVGVREGREPSDGVNEGLSGDGHFNWG
jgi:hypothetical protein